jgi:hypothetical protein
MMAGKMGEEVDKWRAGKIEKGKWKIENGT